MKIREQEKDVQRRIVEFLELHGAIVIENRSGKSNALTQAMRSTKGQKERAKGTCDLYVFAPGGIVLAIEVKRDKKSKPDAAQLAHHAALRALGHQVIVACDHTDIITWAKAVKMFGAADAIQQTFARRILGQ